MQTIADLWHPTLLMFLAATALPIVLFRQRRNLQPIDPGYNAILIGAIIITIAAGIDYVEETPFGHKAVAGLLGGKAENKVLPYFYFPGILFIGYGIAKWLPAVYLVSHEINRRKVAEAELLELLKNVNELAREAEEANRSKSEFLATMSHELRTPLNAVIGFTEMLQTDLYNAPEKREEYLAIIAGSGRHLLNIINDILDLSRLDAGKVPVEAETFDLRELMDECLAYTEPRILEKNLAVSIDGNSMDIESDRRLLKQILLNLMSNAVKFTPDEGTITVLAEKADNNVVISVADTGIGMDEKEIKRAMEPFVQIDNSLSRAHEGTGLGLPLVERFSTLLKGKMSITSEKNVGTTVTITLPIKAPRRRHEHEFI